MTVDVLDLFAGPGGWDVALNELGLSSLGIEKDATACETARSNGHERMLRNVATCDPAYFDATGMVASPPCQGFSVAGNGYGRDDLEVISHAVRGIRSGGTKITRAQVQQFLKWHCSDQRSSLVLEPLMWVRDMPNLQWICWEQVPALLQIWQMCRHVLEDWGWNVMVSQLNAERYGVPQTRKRAVLIAAKGHIPMVPEPTHSGFNHRMPEVLTAGYPSWVSMADVLGVEQYEELISNYGTGANSVARGTRPAWQPAPTITSKASRNKWKQDGTNLTLSQAAILQSFPADYQWSGYTRQQFQQVGDAIPPVLAKAVVAEALGSVGPSDLPVELSAHSH